MKPNLSGRRIPVMLQRLIPGLAILTLIACSSGQQERAGSASVVPSTATSSQGAMLSPDRTAYFAGGCFWGVEHFLEKLDGVASVESGYMGGSVESPSYQQVISKQTGHLETVRVRYDSSRVSYKSLAKLFFEIHDPTQLDGQGPDIGPQYRSAVFYETPGEKAAVEGLIGQLTALGYKVATRLEKADRFWPAEQYHQDYYARSGKTPYCHARIRRFDKSAN